MNSFYAEQKGLFTFYMEQDEEAERIYRMQLENPEQIPSNTHKKKNKKKNAAKMSSVGEDVKLHDKPAPLSLDLSPGQAIKKHRYQPVEQAQKPQIFLHRRQRLKTKDNASVEMRPIPQKPVIVPDMVQSQGSLQMNDRQLSKKLRAIQREKGVYNQHCFLPTIGSGRLISNSKRSTSTLKNQKASNQEAALQLIYSILNIESSKLSSRNKSQLELVRHTKKYGDNVLSYIELPKQEDASRDVARWEKLRKDVANKYHFPI